MLLELIQHSVFLVLRKYLRHRLQNYALYIKYATKFIRHDNVKRIKELI
jgi:hypothetical protein